MIEDKKLDLATKIMGAFIESSNPKNYTKSSLMITYGYDEKSATELAEAAYREWTEAYGG
jgi:hypothetical protein